MENVYLCEKNYLENRFKNIGLRIDNGSIVRQDIRHIGAYPNYKNDDIDYLYSEDSQAGTATINIIGYLAKYKTWSDETSYNDILISIDNAEENTRINKIVFVFDTPGGESGLVDTIWNRINSCSKDTVAIVSGMCCSAGYYIASACDRIKCISSTCIIGSIGVVVEGYDFTEYLEEAGIKHVILTSENAPKKALGIDSEDGIKEIIKLINQMEARFISRVAIGRNTNTEYVIKNFGNGGVMYAKNDDIIPNSVDAIGVGMVDSIITDEKERNGENIMAEKNDGSMATVLPHSQSAHSSNNTDNNVTLSLDEYTKLIKDAASGTPVVSQGAKPEVTDKNTNLGETEKRLAIRNVTALLATGKYSDNAREIGLAVIDGTESYENFSNAVADEDRKMAEKTLSEGEGQDDVLSMAASGSKNGKAKSNEDKYMEWKSSISF